MLPDADACYAALLAHDRRFDGRLFVGVTSTGIYCRPVCAVRPPRRDNCRFFAHAAAAEKAGFRPCLRCRPEVAPGRAPHEATSHLAWAAAQLLESGEVDDLPALAARLGFSARHLRRVFRQELGVTPVDYAQTQRLLLAKRLLADTALPVTEVAFAANFGSLRRFNALFRQRYGLAPTALRRMGAPAGAEPRFEMAYRPPLDWERLLTFLAARAVAGVEEVVDGEYRRAVRAPGPTGARTGWVAVSHVASRSALVVRVSPSLLRGLPFVLAGVRRAFDLSCDPQAVASALGRLAVDAPGLRVPGAFDGFELAVRAIVGQQVTVAAARTIAGRVVAAFGTPLVTPLGAVTTVFPDAATLATASEDALGAAGLVRRRGAAVRALAATVLAGRIDLSPAADVAATVAALRELPGIGEWTAQYVALRALAWPDAWPSGDVALIKAMGAGSRRVADEVAARWSPWRGYAVLHLWRRLAEGEIGVPS
jgi:AraC family transcriptional regulator, regulatory protein of adaptative response / DNA-3-methyladenine glycosylase II